MSWADTGLDARILRAVAKQALAAPTPVQAAAIPAALQGKDVLARARTGSGKTLAYLLPALQRIVAGGDARQPWQVLVLVPTRELCEQVAGEARVVGRHCGAPVSVTPLLGDTPVAQRAATASAGALVVTTPARVATALRERWLAPAALAASLRMLVLDEADLLLSYGYAEDLQALAVHIPRAAQCLLMSATSSAEVEQLQQLVLHNPVTLNLLAPPGGGGGQQQQPDAGGAAGQPGQAAAAPGAGFGHGGPGGAAEIVHCSFACARNDRRLAVLSLLKLGLLRKKVLIFANKVEDGVGLRMFLESFGLRLGCLHAELPINSRSHILASFNKGLFDYLIAVDDVHARDRSAAAAAAAASAAASAAAAADGKGGRKRKRRQEEQASKAGKAGAGGAKAAKAEEFGVTRGIDFKGVRSVINFDLPDSLQGYVHRVGRTGRAGQSGLALTLFTPADTEFQQQLAQALAEQQGGAAAAAAAAAGAAVGSADSDGSESNTDSDSDAEGDGDGGRAAKRRTAADQPLRPFVRLKRGAMEALRYRAEDVGRTITKGAIREARARELQRELLNSERLADYFEEHEAEQALLKHDKPMHRKAGHMPHLRHVPAYLRDQGDATAAELAAEGAIAAAAAQRQPKQKGPKPKKRKAVDPLKAAADGQPGAAPQQPAPAAAAVAPVSRGGVFVRSAKKKGSAADEELTELEKRALAKPILPSKAKVLAGVGTAAHQAKVLGPKVAALAAGAGKHNVRKSKPSAKRRR